MFYSKKIFSKSWFLRFFYLKDQKRIINRYLNEKENWQEHIENTKKYILKRLNEKKPQKVAILGSGWLLDVPIDYFVKNKLSVDLFDIHHPKQIKHKYSKYPFISFIERDLTGGILECARKAQCFDDFIDVFKLRDFNVDLTSYDLVVSVNLLNQLDVLLCDVLKRKFNITDDKMLKIRKQIQKNHINSLPINKTCLITDYSELFVTKKNVIENEKQLVFVDFPNSAKTVEWQWIFDTNMKYREKFNTIFKVKAISF